MERKVINEKKELRVLRIKSENNPRNKEESKKKRSPEQNSVQVPKISRIEGKAMTCLLCPAKC